MKQPPACSSISPVSLESPYKWKISLRPTVQHASPCVSPLSLWKVLTNGKYPYDQPCNMPLHVSLPCLSGKSLQMENILTTNRATCLSMCLSPVSLESPYKWKISLRPTVQHASPCVSPLSLWKILTKGKYPYDQQYNMPLHVSLPCLSGKSLQMENILTTNCAACLSMCLSPVSLENPYKWKISLRPTMQHASPCVSLENPYKWKLSLQLQHSYITISPLYGLSL